MKKQLRNLFSICLLSTCVPLSAQTTVEMSNSQFVPQNITVTEGETVTWVNMDAVAHTSESGSNCNMDNVWVSGDMAQGDSFSFTFNNAGSFDYFCRHHCLSVNMAGNVTVNTATGVSETEPVGVFSITNLYPNPSSGPVNLGLSMTETAEVTVEVYDLSGAKVLTVFNREKRGAGEHQVQISNELSAGTYMCRVTCGDQVVTRLFSKM